MQLFDSNGGMNPQKKKKSKFSLSKNSHFYWIQLNNVIPEAWKENLYNGDKNVHELTFSGYHSFK